VPWWPTMDPHIPRPRGRSQFCLFADEWLPEIAFLIGLPDRRVDLFVESAPMGDLADVTARLTRGVGPSLRDEAMWAALLGNDHCMTTALLGSGVDPNLREGDGSTLLMAAVWLNALGSAKALLDAGADVNAAAELPSPKPGRTPL
jgi:ankyrin repeat protein